MPTPKERTAGFRAALKEQGLEPIASYAGSYEMDNGLKSMERIIAEYPQVDGVFAHSDKIAAGALHVLDRFDKQVPQCRRRRIRRSAGRTSAQSAVDDARPTAG